MKVATLTPFHSNVAAHFAFSLAHLTERIARLHRDIELKVLMNTSSSLPRVRTDLAQSALAWGAEWMLWLDSDMLFPPDTLERLLAFGLDVVGANYPRRMPPHVGTATVQSGTDLAPCETTLAKAQAGQPEQVLTLGFGALLMNARVFEGLDRPWFQIVDDGADGFVGEDMHFLHKLSQHGFVPHVDHALSWDIGHVGERVFTFRDRA
jgi:hypothetical protein